MKIAFFGGSFDPPHLGHDAVVKAALNTLDIDKLIIMPTFINPFKQGFVASKEQRFLWAKKLWGNLEKVEICDFEIKQERPVPSIESVLYLQKRFKPSKIYLIIGADHLASLHSWHEFDTLNKMVEFVVASRLKITIPKEFKKLDIDFDIASSFIRDTLDVSEVCESIKDEVKEYYAKFISKTQRIKMQERIKAITDILDDKKAEQIEVFDMRDKDYFVSFVVLASTLGQRHALSLIDELKIKLKEKGEQFLGIESSEDWSVLDLGDILIHLLSEDYRAKYNLEEFLKELGKQKA
ncbi:ribosome silencing factor RsfS [Campylobacter sp. MIT 12-5580]|nr:ribosome silencing factor RsfS [Campylobacter sp. MIT 12-5580]